MTDRPTSYAPRLRKMTTRTPRRQPCTGCGDTVTTVTLSAGISPSLLPATYDRHDRHSRLGNKVDAECVRPKLRSRLTPLPR